MSHLPRLERTYRHLTAVALARRARGAAIGPALTARLRETRERLQAAAALASLRAA